MKRLARALGSMCRCMCVYPPGHRTPDTSWRRTCPQRCVHPCWIPACSPLVQSWCNHNVLTWIIMYLVHHNVIHWSHWLPQWNIHGNSCASTVQPWRCIRIALSAVQYPEFKSHMQAWNVQFSSVFGRSDFVGWWMKYVTREFNLI